MILQLCSTETIYLEVLRFSVLSLDIFFSFLVHSEYSQNLFLHYMYIVVFCLFSFFPKMAFAAVLI